MKKWTITLATGALAFALSACGQTAEPKEDPITGEKEEVVVKSDLTAAEVMEKANAASEAQQSMHSEMIMKQTMDVNGETHEINSTIDMDMILEPLAMRQTMNMQMDGEEMAIEQFMTEDGFFMKDPESGKWMKFPQEMYEQITGQMADAQNAAVDFTIYEQFADDFTFEQTNDEYVLALKGSGEKFSSLMKEILEQNMPAGMEEDQLDAISQMNVESIDIEFTIDKKTFFTKDFDMDMVMTVEEGDQKVKIDQNIKGTMSKINEIDEIKVPKDILDNAADMDDMMGQ
ncbi:hypothetical protein DV702_11820 [Sporosarcina sp. PTS2304]|uniref:DUF6612 family protein n=1 Tax=Sporosarcina sp. PTS2304 TaxID=2283194 RepID=UPI000E0CCC61|nr:DUF6612 family protein [Sporosarcina sp. PTS2304]AXI00345.1 hypothetical protein DV702_11820 [Sporosarcina sp. PTS2304]